jgi:hypothetical protein
LKLLATECLGAQEKPKAANAAKLLQTIDQAAKEALVGANESHEQAQLKHFQGLKKRSFKQLVEQSKRSLQVWS